MKVKLFVTVPIVLMLSLGTSFQSVFKQDAKIIDVSGDRNLIENIELIDYGASVFQTYESILTANSFENKTYFFEDIYGAVYKFDSQRFFKTFENSDLIRERAEKLKNTYTPDAKFENDKLYILTTFLNRNNKSTLDVWIKNKETKDIEKLEFDLDFEILNRESIPHTINFYDDNLYVLASDDNKKINVFKIDLENNEVEKIIDEVVDGREELYNLYFEEKIYTLGHKTKDGYYSNYLKEYNLKTKKISKINIDKLNINEGINLHFGVFKDLFSSKESIYLTFTEGKKNLIYLINLRNHKVEKIDITDLIGNNFFQMEQVKVRDDKIYVTKDGKEIYVYDFNKNLLYQGYVDSRTEMNFIIK